MDGDFYVTLTSTNDMESFPQNQQSDFRNIMPYQLDFSSKEYEVALCDLILPNQYDLISSSSCYLIVTIRRTLSNGKLRKHSYRIEFTLPNGFSISTLIDKMNKACDDMMKRKRLQAKVTFSLDDTGKYVLFRKEGLLYKVFMPSDLRNILGFEFEREKKTAQNVTEVATIPYDLQYRRHSCWIYSNLVKEHIVGSKKVSLFRVLPLSDYEGTKAYFHRIDNRQYFKVARLSFPYMSISIKDHEGQSILFYGGSVIATLHFRPCS